MGPRSLLVYGIPIELGIRMLLSIAPQTPSNFDLLWTCCTYRLLVDLLRQTYPQEIKMDFELIGMGEEWELH